MSKIESGTGSNAWVSGVGVEVTNNPNFFNCSIVEEIKGKPILSVFTGPPSTGENKELCRIVKSLCSIRRDGILKNGEYCLVTTGEHASRVDCFRKDSKELLERYSSAIGKFTDETLHGKTPIYITTLDAPQVHPLKNIKGTLIVTYSTRNLLWGTYVRIKAWVFPPLLKNQKAPSVRLVDNDYEEASAPPMYPEKGTLPSSTYETGMTKLVIFLGSKRNLILFCVFQGLHVSHRYHI